MESTQGPSPRDGRSSHRIACAACRARKIACDKRQPCALCSKNGFTCEYVSTARKPGLRAGYVSKLENRVASLEARVLRIENDGPAAHRSQTDLMHENLMQERERDEDFQMDPTPEHGIALENDMRPPTHASDAYEPGSVQTGAHSGDANLARVYDTWFAKYHAWCPILHQPTCYTKVRAYQGLPVSQLDVLTKAIAVFTWRDCQLEPLVSDSTLSVSNLARDTSYEAMALCSFDALAALVVLAMHEYGEHETARFRSLLSVCREMATQLRLRELVWRADMPDGIVHAHSPDREQGIRLYWTVHMIDSISALDMRIDIGQAQIPDGTRATLPRADAAWDIEFPITPVGTLSGYEYSSTISLSTILAVTELVEVRRFSLEQRELRATEDMLRWQTAAQQLDERLTNWREEFVASVFRILNAESGATEQAEMEPNIVVTNCVLNLAVITLLQRMAPMLIARQSPSETWLYAANRCVFACDNMAAKVRRMTDEQIRCGNPLLLHSIFAAARFYIVYTKASEADVPSGLRSLAYALHICKDRWKIAANYELIIRTAVSEHRTPVDLSQLPKEFFDLTLTASELNPLLLNWLASRQAPLILSPSPNSRA